MEGAAQILTARFMYGPLDMVSLSGEKVKCTSTLSPKTVVLFPRDYVFYPRLTAFSGDEVIHIIVIPVD